jgi:hypothetical protein
MVTELGTMTHIYSPSIQEADRGGSLKLEFVMCLGKTKTPSQNKW